MPAIDTTTGIPVSHLLDVATHAAVLAKVAKTEASNAYSRAEEDAIEALLAFGIASVTLEDGTKVTLKGGLEGEVTRKVDAEVLRERLAGSVYDAVTTRSVDLKAFDAAVTSGLIPAHVAEEATAYAPKKPTLAIRGAVTPV